MTLTGTAGAATSSTGGPRPSPAGCRARNRPRRAGAGMGSSSGSADRALGLLAAAASASPRAREARSSPSTPKPAPKKRAWPPRRRAPAPALTTMRTPAAMFFGITGSSGLDPWPRRPRSGSSISPILRRGAWASAGTAARQASAAVTRSAAARTNSSPSDARRPSHLPAARVADPRPVSQCEPSRCRRRLEATRALSMARKWGVGAPKVAFSAGESAFRSNEKRTGAAESWRGGDL